MTERDNHQRDLAARKRWSQRIDRLCGPETLEHANKNYLLLWSDPTQSTYRLWEVQTQRTVMGGSDPVDAAVVMGDHVLLLAQGRMLAYYHMEDGATFRFNRDGYSDAWALATSEVLYIQQAQGGDHAVGMYRYNVEQQTYTSVIEGQGWTPCFVH